MDEDIGGKVRMEAVLIPKYNVGDTKKLYSHINNEALKGLEVITYNATKDELSEVSHIKKQYLDYLLSNLRFNPVPEYDEELGIYTIALNEIDIYGEGHSKQEAIDDLLDSLQEYLSIYYEQIGLFTKLEPVDKQLYMLKLLRCNGDVNLMRNTIGL